MNLFQTATGRDRSDSRRAGRLAARAGRLYNIRYAMTPRGLRREEVAVRIRPLEAAWTRDPMSGALTCHWHIAASHGAPKAEPPSPSNLVSMQRRGIHADLRPPSR